MILGQPYGRAIDIWVRSIILSPGLLTNSQALGVLCYEFLCGEEPFGSEAALGSRGSSR